MAEGEPQASSRIFVSYRRDDAPGFVRALLVPLRARFGRERVFKDTDNIPPGQDFVEAIHQELESCRVLLAIIGSEWSTIQDARKQRRLDDPNDTLRIEVAAALKNENITVVPVLVDHAIMPRSEELPEDLSALARRNALELSDTRWDSDVERLVRAIEVICGEAPVQTRAKDPSGGGFERLEVRRKRQLAEHISAAQEALNSKDYQACLAACERAVWLDPQDSEARDLAARAQAALDEKGIQDSLDEARHTLASGQLSAASEAIDHALAKQPDHPDALKLRQELLKARLQRDRQAEVERLAAAELKSAQTSLDDGDFSSALGHADEALALVPGSKEAQDVRAKIVAARAEFTRVRDLKRRAEKAVADANAAWAGGKLEEAIALLSGFSPPHELVSQALEQLRAKAAEAEEGAHLAAAREAAAKEAAEAARKSSDAKLALIVRAIDEKRYAAAQQLVDEARGIDASHPDIAEWETRIRQAIAAHEAAAAQARREREAHAAKEAREAADRRRRDADAKLAQAAVAIDEKRYDAAKNLVAAARKLDSSHPDLEEWTTRIGDAIAADAIAEEARQEREAEATRAQEAKAAADRARRDADAKLALAAMAIEEKRYDAAGRFVDAARGIDSSHPDLAEWKTRIRDGIAADAAAEQARLKREARAARAKEEAEATAEHARREAERADLDTAERAAREKRARPQTGEEQVREERTAPRPSWVKYAAAAAAAVLGAGVYAASGLFGTDPPTVVTLPVPPTAAAPQPASKSADPPVSSAPEGPRTGPGRPGTAGAGSTTGAANDPPRRGTDPPVKPDPPPVKPDPPPVKADPPPVPPAVVPKDPDVATPSARGEDSTAELAKKRLAEDIAEIRGLLDQYAKAYQTLDDRRVRAVDPGFRGIPSRMLIKKVTVTFQDPQIVVRGQQATVLAPAIYRYEWQRAGNPPSSESRSVTWTLAKEGSRWKVVSSN
jgi:TIR domain